MSKVLINCLLLLAILTVATSHEGCTHDHDMKDFYEKYAEYFDSLLKRNRFLDGDRNLAASDP